MEKEQFIQPDIRHLQVSVSEPDLVVQQFQISWKHRLKKSFQ